MAVTDTVSHLQKILCNDSGPSSTLALRFRALFSLKHLASLGDLSAIDAIASAFTSDSALLKHELAYCLGQTRNPHAAPHLQRILQTPNEDPMVRHEAAEALGALCHVESLPLLQQHLNDPSEEVRQTCEIAIARIDWELSQSSTKTPETIRPSAFASIDPAPPLPILLSTKEEQSEDVIPTLQSTLTDQSLSLFHRYRAMFRLRNIATPPAIDALATGFSDPSALFRHEIAFVFGQLSDPHSIPALVKVASNKDEAAMVRHEAVEALGSIGTEEVDEFLKEYAKDEERVVRESAIVALDMAAFEKSGELEYALVPGKEEGVEVKA